MATRFYCQVSETSERIILISPSVEIRIYHSKDTEVQVVNLNPITLWEFKSFVHLTRCQYPNCKIQVRWTFYLSRKGKEQRLEMFWMRHEHRSDDTIKADFLGDMNPSDFRQGYFSAVKKFLLELMVNEIDADLQQLARSIQSTLDVVWKPKV